MNDLAANNGCEDGADSVSYDFMPVAGLSILHEYSDREGMADEVQERLETLGVEPEAAGSFITETLPGMGLAELETGRLAVTAAGTEYLAARRDWVEGTYRKRARLYKFAPSSYVFMNYFQTQADAHGWATAKADYLAETLGVSESNITHRIGDFRREGIIETDPPMAGEGGRTKRARLLRYGEARLEAMRVMFGDAIARLEAGELTPSQAQSYQKDRVNAGKLSIEEVELRLAAVSDELGRMRGELGEPAKEDDLKDIKNLDDAQKRTLLNGLTAEMRGLEEKLTGKTKTNQVQ